MTMKPEMSRHEASWHEHLAGMRAAEAARKAGSNPAVMEALATATVGPINIGGFILEPASRGTVTTLRRTARAFRAWADSIGMPKSDDVDEELSTRDLLDLGLSVLVFCDSARCWIDLETGQFEQMVARADALIWKTPNETLRKLEKHFRAQMKRIDDLTEADEDTPGK